MKVVALGFFFTLATPAAAAEPAFSLSVLSDYRFRGYTLSQGRPVATITLSYDDPKGLYGGLSAIGVLGKSGPHFLALQENVGFAKRLSSGLTLDAGITNSNFTRYYNDIGSSGYTEVYLGLLGRRVATHIHFSPNYFRNGVIALYAEVNGVVRPATHWRLNWHVGAQNLSYRQGGHHQSRTQLDWRLGITREVGATEFQIAVSRGGSRPKCCDQQHYDRTAIVAAVTHAF